ncbi:MAG: Mini-ribonuclease 3 [Clostridiaceae bacterium]|jgi:ribonuclease-3 family protein|nr:Mini-ribonuclease 3 [Clostridiaceae bacterium]
MEQRQEKISLQVKQFSPLVLAWVGDSVFDLFIRCRLAMRKSGSAHKLHVKAISYVSAEAQSSIADVLYYRLNEEEKAIFRRGRNSKSATIPKHADVLDYRRATALEAVLGYLHLCGKKERLNELLNMAVNIIEQAEDTKKENGS